MRIDIIVLDLMMPERSGFDIFRALQTRLVSMPPVIMLTAVTGMQQRIDARDLGVTKYLTKPTTPSRLIETIKEVLEENRKDTPKGKTINKFIPHHFIQIIPVCSLEFFYILNILKNLKFSLKLFDLFL